MIGVDLVKTERIEQMMARFGTSGLERFLSADEIALVKNARTAAGFWAAKEACAKALGCGIGAECGFHDMIISKTPKGAPTLSLSPAVRDRFNIADAALSISHDGAYAVAVVALEKD